MPRFLNRLFRCSTLLLPLVLVGCASLDKYSFETFGRPKQTLEHYDPKAGPPRSDLLALHYADYVAKLLEGRSTGSRVTRELSDSSMVIGGALAGAQETLGIAASSVATMGVGMVVTRELQGVFNARGRSEAFADAAYLIRQAQAEYRAFNPKPSDIQMTENGATLVRRVDSALYAARKTLNGRMPTLLDLQQTVQPMSVEGARKTGTGPTHNLATATGEVPLPPMTQQQAYDPRNTIGNITATSVDVRADQTTISNWITERNTAKDYPLLRQFIRKAGRKPNSNDTKLSGQARLITRDATTREGIDKLLEYKETPLEITSNTSSAATTNTTDSTTTTTDPSKPSVGHRVVPPITEQR